MTALSTRGFTKFGLFVFPRVPVSECVSVSGVLFTKRTAGFPTRFPATVLRHSAEVVTGNFVSFMEFIYSITGSGAVRVREALSQRLWPAPVAAEMPPQPRAGATPDRDTCNLNPG